MVEASVWDGCLFQGPLPPVRAPHSGTFQHSGRQSTVRGPGTDPRSACQQLISLIELARDPKSHVHHTRRHRRNTCATRCVHCSTQRHLAEGYERAPHRSAGFLAYELRAEALKRELMVVQTATGCHKILRSNRK